MVSLVSQENNGQKPNATLQILGTAEDYSGVRGVLFADTYGVANLDDTKAVSYQWFADGDVISGATQQTLDVGDYFSLVENKDITVSLTFTDNASQETTITSAEMPFGGFRIVANAEDGRNEWQWETVSEEVDTSVNPYPLVESYSWNGTSNTSGTSAGSAHNITAVKASDEGFTAREGENVIRIYANGDRSNRSELAHLNNETKFQEGEEFYFSGSFYASREEWDPVTEDHSTVITQLKQYGGGDPNFELRLSNEGDYKMTWRAVPHDLKSHQDLGYATPDAWNDLKIYMKHSQGSDGIFQVWLNDQQVIDYQGSTMYRDADGYLKFGMYTEIFDERVLFWDAIDISDHLTTDFDTWLSSGNNLPSITLIGVTNNQQFEDSGSVVISGVANDLSGNQLGSTGGIQKVELFRNDVHLKSTTDANFSFSELNLDNGEHALRVVVEDTDGNKAEEIVTVWVGNKPPVVLLENQGTLADHALAEQLTLSATAYDEDGSVSGVSFYVNDEMLDTVNTPTDGKYLLPWSSTNPGMYTFSARAFDDEGDIGVSQDWYVAVEDDLKSLEILSSEDANIKPADADYNGNWGELGVYGKESDPKVAILSFDVSELASAGAIRTAALDVYVTDLRTETESTYQFSIYSTDNSEWDETTVTSANGPTKGTLVDTITIDDERETFSFDIAAALKNALAEGSSNLTLWIEDANLNDDIREEFEFHSWKKDNPPKITIEYGEFSLNAQYNEGTQEIVVDNNGDHDDAQIDGGTNNVGEGTNNSTAGATRLYAIQDASILANSNTNGNWSKNEVYGGSTSVVALVEFDLSSFSQGDKVKSATFSPYIRSLIDKPSSDFSIYSTSSKEWNQDSIEWSTRPLKEELLDTVLITQSGNYVDFDVAKAVQQAIDNGQSTVTFWVEDSENENQGFEFDSVNQNPDYPNEPQLNVVLGEFIEDSDLADTSGSDLLAGTAQADNITAGEGTDLVQADAGIVDDGIAETTPAFDIVLLSQTDGVATFAIYADESVDPDNDGTGSFEFTLSHDQANMLIDASSYASGTGYTGVPNYNATTGVLTTGAFAFPNVTDTSIPLATFSATILNETSPISLTISDVLVDADPYDDVTESFDFSTMSVRVTTLDRFGNNLTPDTCVGYEATEAISPASSTGNTTVFDVTTGSDAYVSAYKDIDDASDRAIGAFDALQAIRLAVGLDKSDGTSEWHDFIAADINQDGRVGADDALNILKFAVGLDDGPSAEWVFVDSDEDYSGIGRSNTSYDQGVMLMDVFADTSVDMTGILLGDLDGSFIA